eukprot:CAMPEP_0180630656 /NCGR_PEP_ID=MMETSP1037_2-20121125/40112_1 /TAXON_ID=632150 /ORGANISM="Azadinium spinosum, Strain 3D9" /LENGTH=49 /DNA_ID= /DNA_START= /DNA_END= /DNA_ORIENTATION=
MKLESEVEDVRKEQRSLLQEALNGIDHFHNSYLTANHADDFDPEDASST